MLVFGLDVWVFLFACAVVGVSSYIITGMMWEAMKQ